jgi:hypothetical protein
MRKMFEGLAVAAALSLLGAALSPAWAQATRTWVSGVGDDVNPCSRTAPCKTFPGAISKTAAGGEINAIDPGGFGAVTITKSITIDGGGTLAGIVPGATNAIVVNAGVNDVVILRNLSIDGTGSGVNGIRFIAGGSLHVENVHIFGFSSSGGLTGNGIDFNPSGNAKLFISNSSIRNNDFVGVLVRPQGSANAQVTLSHVHLENNTTGMFVSDGGTVSVVDSVSSGNSGTGFQTASSARLASIQLERSVSSNNGTYGVRTDGPFSQIWLSNSTIVNNFIGLASAGGNIVSFVNNAIGGNSSADGSVTIAVPLR